MESLPLAVELQSTTKRFGTVLACDHVDLQVKNGSVHALVGENGAGKSTLIKMLGGLLQPDAGEIRIDGRPMRFRSPADAIAAGIGVVHQHFMLIPEFTVAENVVLGAEPSRLLHENRNADAVVDAARRSGMQIDPHARVRDLSVGQQQRVEIVKVLYRRARIIILDEPTAVLTPQEADELLETIEELRQRGATILLVTHKLREVMAVADRVTVVRAGRHVATMEAGDTSAREIGELMVGRTVATVGGQQGVGKVSHSPENSSAVSPPVLDVQDLTVRSKGVVKLDQVSLSVAPGQILGIAGVEGNGQTELVEALAGLLAPTSGRIVLRGRDITRKSVRSRGEAGLAVVHEDRHRRGLVLPFSLRENLMLGRHHRRRDGLRAFAGARAAQALQQFDVRPANPRARAADLSGGNQQKVVLAREFTRKAACYIISQPTRGVDLGAIEDIHGRILQLKADGAAILLVSAELSELLALSDQVAVIFQGRIVHQASVAEGIQEHQLGYYMAGGTDT